MNKKLVLVVVVGLVIISIGIFLFIKLSRDNSNPSSLSSTNVSNTGSQSSQSTGVSPISKALFDQLVADLGVPSSQEQPNFLTDKAVSTSSLTSAKAYNSILSTYRVLPEQLVNLKSEVALGKTELPNPIAVNFSNLGMSPTITSAVAQQGNDVAQSNSVPVFVLEGTFDDVYYKNLAKSFGMDNPTITKDNATGLINISQAGTTSNKALDFNPASGSFSFEAKGDYSKSQSPSSPEAVQAAQNYLYNNPALSSYARNIDSSETTTYEKRGDRGVAYVVFHRGWIPLPILNSRYIYGIKKFENTIRDTARANFSKLDSDIFNTSDQMDGYARSEGFNTIVVKVAKEGIASVTGNMRPLKQDVGMVKLISAKQAYESAVAGSYFKVSLVSRTGNSADYSKFAEAGNLKLTDGNIDAIHLAYNEEPLNLQMNYLQPVYIMRGTAKAGTEEVLFSFVTQAIASEVKVSSLLEVSASDLVDSYIGQGESWAKEGQSGTGIGAWKPPATNIGSGSSSTAPPAVKNVTTPWLPGITFGGGGLPGEDYSTGSCPIINVYSKSAESFVVKPRAEGKVTYSYPELTKDLWNVVSSNTGKTLVDGKSYNSLNYEFNSDQINTPTEGYVVLKNQTIQFLKNELMPKLSLTEDEIESYLLEVNYYVLSRTKANSNYYKISLVPRSEIEKFLPLETAPKPESQIRNFLVFEELESRPNYIIKEPTIDAVNRQGLNSLLVENGCMLK